MDRQVIRKTYRASETKQVQGEDRTLIVRISTKTPDRSNDVVLPGGVVLDNYFRNPVVAFGHNYSGLSIGKTTEINVADDGILAKVVFPPKGVYELADTLYELYKDNFMNAWSIGFIPLETEDRPEGGMIFKKWELLEYSAVMVPDNPEALTVLRTKGIDTKPIEKALKQAEEKPEDKKTEKEPEKKEDPVETKEGRVLSEKNRKLISNTVTLMKDAVNALDELMKATEAAPDEEKSNKKVEIPLVEALKMADKVIGVALRDYKGKSDKKLPVKRKGGE